MNQKLLSRPPAQVEGMHVLEPSPPAAGILWLALEAKRDLNPHTPNAVLPLRQTLFTEYGSRLLSFRNRQLEKKKSVELKS